MSDRGSDALRHTSQLAVQAWTRQEPTDRSGRTVDEPKRRVHRSRREEQHGSNAGASEGFDVMEEPAAGDLGPESLEGDADLVVEVLESVAPGKQCDRPLLERAVHLRHDPVWS